jgi:hypothetical protein
MPLTPPSSARPAKREWSAPFLHPACNATDSTRYRWGDVARQRHWRERRRDLAASIARAVTTRRSTTPQDGAHSPLRVLPCRLTACGVLLRFSWFIFSPSVHSPSFIVVFLFFIQYTVSGNRASTASIATRPRTGRPGNPGSILDTGQEILLFSTWYRPAWGPTQSRI